ncbi:MAG: DUF1822 family protein [Leptolyngbyaceae cyanobacterium MO_188.B28]|nr:DUF1822 family protein [Leptolyngbyaceae cyanobacterium MO_188.B28]
MLSSPYENDLRLLEPEIISLEVGRFEQATQLSDPIIGEARQWQTYLNALALLGFTQWIREQSGAIEIRQEDCSLLRPHYANVLDSVCNLRVGQFKVCLVAAEHLLNEVVAIPRAALDLPEFTAHFYVVIEVQEEHGQALIRGYGRYDQLIAHRQAVDLQADRDWNYRFPLDLFDAEPNHLLFHLQTLHPTAIPLPTATASAISALTATQLLTLLTRWRQSPEQHLWRTLTWEQGVTLLQSTELLELLYQWRRSPTPSQSLQIRITEVFTLLTQQAINTAQWIRNELDELAQSLGWFSAQMATSGAFEFRTIDRFRAAIEELRYQGMEIPTHLSPMYQEIEWEGELFRLCAATWSLVTSAAAPQWALLLILGTQMGNPLPDGLKLRVADLNRTLYEEQSELDTEMLYARVDALQGDKLIATIVAPNGEALVSAPYRFEVNPS